jgi:hypothetical protein
MRCERLMIESEVQRRARVGIENDMVAHDR